MKKLLSVAAAVVLISCDDGDTSGAGGEPAELPDITFKVVLLDATAAVDTVLEGVEVCVADRSDIPCAVSDANGSIELELPANSELMLRCEGPTHGPMYMTWTIGQDDIDADTFRIIASPTMDALMVIAGAEQWPERGAIIVNVYEDLATRDKLVAGATFTLTPDGGDPVYVSEAPLPDPELEATTIGGPGVFLDLVDGEVTVSIDHPRPCSGGLGWETGSATSLRSKIFAGGLSSVTFVCPP